VGSSILRVCHDQGAAGVPPSSPPDVQARCRWPWPSFCEGGKHEKFHGGKHGENEGNIYGKFWGTHGKSMEIYIYIEHMGCKMI